MSRFGDRSLQGAESCVRRWHVCNDPGLGVDELRGHSCAPVKLTIGVLGACRCRWSMGVLAFELVAGVPPFMHDDRMVMYRRIVDGVYTCPPHFSAVRPSLLPMTNLRL